MRADRRWQRFVNKLNEYQSLPLEQWNHNHFLGYFLDQSKRTIEPENDEETGYKKFPSEPGRHSAVRNMDTLCRRVGSKENVKAFLDWCISIKCLPQLKLLDQFNKQTFSRQPNLSLTNSINRSTMLPIEIANIANNLPSPNKTYGDLAFLHEALPNHQAFQQIRDKGFDLEILKKVI